MIEQILERAGLLFWSRGSAPEFVGVTPTTVVDEADAEYMVPSEAAAVFDECLAGHTMMIEYVDSAGVSSSRRVTIVGIDAGTPGYIHARCHERKALRTFRLDRIRAIIDRYGEVFEPPGKYFEQRFGVRSEELFSPSKFDTSLRAILNELRPGLVLLTALASSDGFLHPDEQEAMLRYCDDCCALKYCNLSPQIVQSLETHIERLSPINDKALVSAVKALARSPYVRIFRRAAREVIEADGMVSVDESAMYRAINDALALCEKGEYS